MISALFKIMALTKDHHSCHKRCSNQADVSGSHRSDNVPLLVGKIVETPRHFLIYICVYMYVRMCVCMYICMHVYMQVCAVCMYKCMYVHVKTMHVCMHSCMYELCMYPCMLVCVSTETRTYVHEYMQIHTCTT